MPVLRNVANRSATYAVRRIAEETPSAALRARTLACQFRSCAMKVGVLTYVACGNLHVMSDVTFAVANIDATESRKACASIVDAAYRHSKASIEFSVEATMMASQCAGEALWGSVDRADVSSPLKMRSRRYIKMQRPVNSNQRRPKVYTTRRAGRMLAHAVASVDECERLQALTMKTLAIAQDYFGKLP